MVAATLNAHALTLDVGAATTPIPGQQHNGDTFVIVHRPGHVLVGVIDGLGHGELAQVASQCARERIEELSDRPLAQIFRDCEVACRPTRGVVMTLAEFDLTARTVQLAAVGNVEARALNSDAALSFVIRRGIVGHNSPEPRIITQPWSPAATLVLYSDGVARSWPSPEFWDPNDASKSSTSAEQLAASLLHRHSTGTDDATVLVVCPADDG